MADYNYIVKSIVNAKPKYNVSFDRLNRTVNIGGVGYSGGSLSRAFKSSGSSSDIMNNFFKANKDQHIFVWMASTFVGCSTCG